jgi:DNA-binding PadR family transcriptional regulator
MMEKASSLYFPLTSFSFCFIISTSHISALIICNVDSYSVRKTEGVHMKQRAGDPEALLPLTSAAFHILLALTGEERHGYGIMQETTLSSDGKVKIGPGTLYRSIRRLLDDGLIEESDERPVPDLDDERRHYYRLTPFGLRVVRAEAQRLAALVRIAQSKQLLPQPGASTLEGGV